MFSCLTLTYSKSIKSRINYFQKMRGTLTEVVKRGFEYLNTFSQNVTGSNLIKRNIFSSSSQFGNFCISMTGKSTLNDQILVLRVQTYRYKRVSYVHNNRLKDRVYKLCTTATQLYCYCYSYTNIVHVLMRTIVRIFYAILLCTIQFRSNELCRLVLMSHPRKTASHRM